MSSISDDTPREGNRLPDPQLQVGPFRPFQDDPGWSEAWWWLGIPAVLATGLIIVNNVATQFYRDWILPEGYGFLELGHFFIPLTGFILALWLLKRPAVRARRLLLIVVLVAAVACFYIAGEEHSWGQHFFNWQTPDYWADLNRQQETNLHNVTDLFDKKPRLLLELGTLIGGLLIPLAAQFNPWIRRNRWSLFLPASAMFPVALGALLFKSFHFIEKHFAITMPLDRPAEATESFLYLFILFYLIILARRVGELEREAG